MDHSTEIYMLINVLLDDWCTSGWIRSVYSFLSQGLGKVHAFSTWWCNLNLEKSRWLPEKQPVSVLEQYGHGLREINLNLRFPVDNARIQLAWVLDGWILRPTVVIGCLLLLRMPMFRQLSLFLPIYIPFYRDIPAKDIVSKIILSLWWLIKIMYKTVESCSEFK